MRRSRHSNEVDTKKLRAVRLEALEPRQLLHGVSAITPYNGQQNVAVGANIVVTFDGDMLATSINASTIQLRDASNNLVPATVTYNATAHTATLDPTANLAASNNFYFAKVVSGAGGVIGSDGDPLAADFNFAFTTGKPIFNDTTVFSGLVAPTNIKFAPNGKVFVAEKSGIIKVYDDLNDTTPDIFADLRTQVHNYWDRGLLGLAIDPNFTNGRPYIYVLYTYDAPIGGTAPTFGTVGGTSDGGGPSPTGTGAMVSGRLSRLTANGNTMVPGSEVVLINDWAQQFPSHSVGELQFGADGYLYATGGDGASFNYADYGQTPGTPPINDPVNEGGALRAQDIRSTGDPTNLNGSLIRIDPQTGLAASGNPTTAGDANAQRIIAYGMRNPFRFTFRPGTNEVWIGDVGWSSWEEIDRVVSPTDPLVENFGWPAYEGVGRQGSYDALNLPLLESLYNTPGAVVSPYYTYDHGLPVVAGSGEPLGGSSISGEAFYNGGTYPSAYDGALFFADYSRTFLYVMYRGVNGLPDPTTLQVFKDQTNGSVYLTAGPNGDLFYVDMDNGKIGRFTFNSNNSSPTARIVVDKTSGNTPLVVNFDATTSTDPDAGDTLTYAWDLDGDGNFNDSTLAKPTYTYTTNGGRTVKLLVTDRGGLTNIASQVINVNVVNNTAPVPTILSPQSTLHPVVGEIVNFNGSAFDTEDGTLAASQLTWTVAMIHGNYTNPASQHTHVIQTFTGTSSGSFQVPDHGSPSWLELRLTAVDSQGAQTTTVLRVDPQATQITMNANIGGVNLALNSEDLPAPFTRAVFTGSNNSVSAPITLVVGGTTYTFNGWSDGGAINHNFTAPNVSDYTLTANYLNTTTANTKLGGTIIGTAGSFQGLGDSRDKAFDGNVTTFFDAPEQSGGAGNWVGLDLGSPMVISQVRFFPRSTWSVRMLGGKFQGSNVADFSTGVVDLYVLNSEPQDGVYTTVAITDPAAYRYVRYLSPADGWGNVAEVEFYTPSGSINIPSVPTGLTATAISTSRIDLAWTDNASNESGFTVERKTGVAGAWGTLATINSPNVVSYSDTTAAANTQYYYRISAFNGGGTSIPSAEANATTPAANPTLLKLTGTVIGTAGSFQGLGNSGDKAFDGNLATYFDGPEALNGNGLWVGLDLGTAQRVAEIHFAPRSGFPDRMVGGVFQGSNTADFSAGVTTLYTVATNPVVGSLTTVAIANTNTFRYVRFLSPNGGWGNVAEVEFYTPGTPPPTVPAAPTALAATTASTTQINLAWTENASNETGFRIERKTGVAGTWAAVITINTANLATYSDTGLSPSTQYYYRVIAVNAVGDSSLSNEANATTLAVPTVPAAPTSLTATAISTTQINLAWTDNANNETGFRIERKTGVAGTWAAVTTVNTVNLATFSDTGLTASTQYYYRVIAVNGVGDSGLSNEANATTLAVPTVPAAPTALTATAVSTTQIDLAWTDNANNETGFRIERKTGVAGTWAAVTTVNTPNLTTYSDIGLTAGTQYYYRVIAVNAVGDSGLSNEANATTQQATVTLSFASSPAGVALTLDGAAISGGVTSVVGVQHTLAAPATVTISGTVYNFTSWSDGGAATHVITTPAINTIYNATYVAVVTATPVYLSDLTPTGTPVNGWGPFEKDKSNGELGASDGKTITLAGVTFAKGLGVHANSDITYTLGGQYATFISHIGVDDEVGSNGSVTFIVYLDGVQAYNSGAMTGSTATKSISLNVAGKQTLRLVVDKGTSDNSDHADWAGARLLTATGALPAGMSSSDIGSVGVAGSAGFVNGNYVVSGSGTDIGGTADSLRYVYQQITGNVQLTARVTSLGSTNVGAKAGVMLRTSLAANSISAGMFVTAGSGYAATRRTTAGGSTTATTGGTSAFPYWVRIVRSGTTVTTYRSADGVAWTLVSTATVNLGTTIYVGLGVTSKSNTALTTAVFDNVSITALP